MSSNGTTERIRAISAATIVALGLTVGLSACGAQAQSAAPSPHITEVHPPGDIPDNQAYVMFTSSSGAFELKVPEGWSKSTSGSSTTFTDKLNSITIDQSSVASPPTVASARTKQVSALQASKPKFQLTDVTTFKRSGGSGVLVTYLDDSAPNTVTGSVVRQENQLFLFWKNGQQVALTLAAPQGADNVDPWNIVTKSFTWLK